MLKAVFKGRSPTGRSTFICGLSYHNLERLKEGKPISVDGSQIGLPFDVFIFAGETEQSMGRDLAEYIGPNTRVAIDKKMVD